jgi:O-antigen/teichoic acid export membrane protein/tRNA A-37 threonylcarbamoyl transferase component Bud32
LSEGRKIADSAPPLSTRQMRPLAGASIENLRQVVSYVSGLISREHVLSLGDQAVVSGTSFVTTLLIARGSGSSQLGIYALGMSLLLSFVAFQDSLISQPYSIKRHYPEGTPDELAGATLMLSMLFSAGSILMLTFAALCILEWGASSDTVAITWAMAGIAPFVLTRDFTRRFAFAHLEMGRALLLDLIAAIIQLSALGWLSATGRMSAVNASIALGAACAIPTAIWLAYARPELTIRMPHVPLAFRQSWALGKWLLAGRITAQVQGYMAYWITMLIAGPSATGAYAACMSIVGVANPVLMGLTNVLMPKTVLAWKNGGGPALWHEVIRNTVLIAALVVPLSLAAFGAGESVMRFLYHGNEFEGLGHTLTVLVVAMSVGALGLPPSNALAAIETPRAIVITGLVGAVVTVVLISLLMPEWGLLGAAYGLLGGSVVGAVGRWVALIMRVPKVYDPTPVMRALQEFTNNVDNSRWAITRIGEGGDADVFLISSTVGQPIWKMEPTLVAKLYKPEIPLSPEMVHAQYNSLSKLHAVLNGREINGWTVFVPRPLYVCASPLALVMTVVPGANIEFGTSKGDVLKSQMLHNGARAFANAMERCWSSGRRHGDLTLQNVLLDVEGKKISFIDAGTLESCNTCNDSATQFAAASDIGHLLWHSATGVMDLIDSPTVRTGREMFVESVLVAILENIESRERRRQFLEEAWVSAQQHLTDRLYLSWSARGIWHRIVKKVAINRIRSILERVDSQSNVWTEESGQREFKRAM